MKRDLKERLEDYIKDIDWSIENCQKELDLYKSLDMIKMYEYRRGEINSMKEINEVLKAIVKEEL